ncbi:ATP-dependent helicase, partial [Dolichospermum sp. ST_sed4]|nr:ATP-dependent helicase [Dolichospermum sp. ST_sed4]
VKLDDGKVISMKSLLSLLENAPQSKFIKLDDGSFVTLADNFRSQLAELNQVSHGNKIFNLSSSSLQNLVNDTSEVQLDNSWNEHIKRLNNIKKHDPIIPPTLQTPLRDYQVDGFKYLSRLANWNIGACLADDMGLGKTVQTIAL